MRQRIIKTLLCTVLAMVSFTANAQVKAFEKYADMKNVSYVYISKYMLGMAGKVATPAAIPGVDIRALASKLTGIQIITAEETTVRKKLKNDVKEILARDKYEVLMQIREDDSKVDIYHCMGKQQSVVVMMVDEDDNATVIVFSGKFNIEDVMKMVQE